MRHSRCCNGTTTWFHLVLKINIKSSLCRCEDVPGTSFTCLGTHYRERQYNLIVLDFFPLEINSKFWVEGRRPGILSATDAYVCVISLLLLIQTTLKLYKRHDNID